MRSLAKWFAVAAGVAALWPLSATAAETVKIGLILSLSGQGAPTGDVMDKAVNLYVKQHRKELGDTKLEIITRDGTGPNPDRVRRLAQELITRDQVNLITGLIYTPNAMAVAPLATEAKVPVVIMTAATSSILTKSPYMVRLSFTMWQQGYPFGQWAASHGIRRAFTAVSDYGPGYDSEQAFIKGFTEAGGEIVGSVRMPVNTIDFTAFLQRIKDLKPEALFVFVPAGKEATALMKGYAELQLASEGIKLIGASDVVPDDELPNMAGVPEGVLTMGPYSTAAKRPANKAFLAAWKSEYGDSSRPNQSAVFAYDAMAAIFHVIKEQKGKIDPDKTMALLKAWSDANSPRGPIVIDPETRNVVENMYVRRLQTAGGGLANVELETIPMVKDPWYRFNADK